MTTQTEAMKLALESLEDGEAGHAAQIIREALVEQPAQQDIPDLIAGALGVSRGTAYDMMREALAEASPPDPCCWPGTSCDAQQTTQYPEGAVVGPCVCGSWPGGKCLKCPRIEKPAPDYAWPTVQDYEADVGFKVNDAFQMGWDMARTTNDLFKQMGSDT
jgi:hypothetical protein